MKPIKSGCWCVGVMAHSKETCPNWLPEPRINTPIIDFNVNEEKNTAIPSGQITKDSSLKAAPSCECALRFTGNSCMVEKLLNEEIEKRSAALVEGRQ